jgi:macrolide export ATP-binding/permease protein macB
MQQAPFARGAIISARNLHKSYGNNPVLRNVSLDIFPGESVAIMGPSGSGKTTLLHALSGIIKLDAGSVLFNGPTGQVAVESLSERERTSLRANSFGFVFQQGLLVPELTAEENVSLAAMIAGVPRQQARSISADLLNRLGLGQMLDRRMGEMSGGQAQRVAIARSQVNGAPVTFADEPTGALDSKTAREVMALLLTMIPQQGKTLLVVTHDPNVAAACSRVVYLQDGQIVSDQRNNQGGVPASQNHAQSFGAQSQAGA